MYCRDIVEIKKILNNIHSNIEQDNQNNSDNTNNSQENTENNEQES